MNYRWVNGWQSTDDEWNKIDEILAGRGWMSWNRDTTRVLLAEDDGKIVGFLPIQLIPHTEPLWVDKNYYGQGVAEKLADGVLEFMLEVKARGWLVIADNPIAAQFCEDRGMEKIHAPVYAMVGKKVV